MYCVISMAVLCIVFSFSIIPLKIAITIIDTTSSSIRHSSSSSRSSSSNFRAGL